MSIPGTVGDVDHLVVTPVRVCVVEAKYRRVYKKVFPKVLSRLSNNVKAVRQWVPFGTRVEGYLVLHHEDGVSLPRDYKSDGERIVACTQSWLRKEIHLDIQKAQTVDKKLFSKVWELGRLDEDG